MLKLYNTASRKLENFKASGEEVKIYTCGPTVYSTAHIGNLTAYIYWDLLVRALKATGYKVRRVLNLTDVGHLSSDGDEGEDKLEKGARCEGKSVWEIAQKYIDQFQQDYRSLSLLEPETWARATDYIEEDKRAVDLMTKNGFTYETCDGIYYDTAKFSRYADFAHLDLAGLKAGARVGFSSEKRNASDFAVWKFVQPNEKHAMQWQYLGRAGYPGWHLECATIIHQTLGEPIDIHCGGMDHIPVHHSNEIAECFAAYGTDLAHVWLHCGFITIDGKKISKSLGNTYTLSDLTERDYSPLDFKLWVLSGHYQGTRNFTFESLEAARIRRLNWRNRIAECFQCDIDSTKDAFVKILATVEHNLNSSEAFALIDNMDLSFSDWQKIDELFGLGLIQDALDVDDDIKDMISKRQAARERKEYKEADKLRELLLKRGITVKDTECGPVWQYLY